jgi:hypothetical protein
VFADLGFPDAAERQVKLRLAYCVYAGGSKASGREAAAGYPPV